MTSGFVVDASVAIKWLLEEDLSDQARLLEGAPLFAPDIMPIEVANVLWKKSKIGQLSRREASAAWDLFQTAPVRMIPGQDLASQALELAIDLGHPIYDCLYLALARNIRLPFVSADRRLRGVLGKHPPLRALFQPLEELSL